MTAQNVRQVKKVIESVAGIFAFRPSRYRATVNMNYTATPDVLSLPTGFRSLDKALGTGGLPYRKLTELMSPGDTYLNGGATTIAARLASKAQRKFRTPSSYSSG